MKELIEYKPFPTECLPPILKRLVNESAESLGCDPALVVLPLLSACAGLVGNRYRLQLTSDRSIPCIIWTMVIAESGGMKSPAMNCAIDPIKSIQSELFEQAADNPVRRIVVNDTTIEALAVLLSDNRNGVLLQRDELAGWFASLDQYRLSKGADASIWLSIFDGSSLMVDRKTGNKRTIHVPRASVSICGGIQPAVLQKTLPNEHQENGMAARFLMAMPPRNKIRWCSNTVSDIARNDYDRLLRKLALAGNSSQVSIVRPSQEGLIQFTDFVNRNGEEQYELTEHLFSVWAKMQQYAARLALLFHCLNSANEVSSELSTETMHAGIDAAEWFKHEYRRIHQQLFNPGSAMLIKVKNKIESLGGAATSREVAQGIREIDPAKAEQLMNRLSNLGIGQWSEFSKGVGRSTRQFRLRNLPHPDD